MMTDNLKKILEEASRDEDLAERIKSAPTVDAVISLAREKGFDLTEEDLRIESSARKLSDDELDAVAGGNACACVFGGGGEPDTYYKSKDFECGCVLPGVGFGFDVLEPNKTIVRCACVGAGGGGLCVLHSDP